MSYLSINNTRNKYNKASILIILVLLTVSDFKLRKRKSLNKRIRENYESNYLDDGSDWITHWL